MATASYLRNNDYTVNNIKPYELPYANALQELATKQQYWAQGAQKVYAAYTQVSGLNPTLSANKENLKNFIKSADEQLKKVVNSDLSVTSNAAKVKEIYSPLYDASNPMSESILLDDQLGKFYKQQLGAIETSKQGDGKTYSANNEAYVKQQYQKYLSDVDNPQADIKSHWQKKRDYIPYYDYVTEFNTITKNCSSDKQTSTSPFGQGYMFKNEVEALSSQKLNNCIQSALSPKAVTQMKIDGIVTFGDNPDIIKQNYLKEQQSKSDSYKNQISQLSGNYQALLQNPKITEDEKGKYREQYNQAVEGLKEQVRATDITIGKINGGDTNWFNANLESIAGHLYTNGKISSYANAYSYSKQEKTFSADQVQLAQMKMEQVLQMMQLKHDLGANSKGTSSSSATNLYNKDGSINPNASTEVQVNDVSVLPINNRTLKDLEKDLATSKSNTFNAAQEVYNTFVEKSKYSKNLELRRHLFKSDGTPMYADPNQFVNSPFFKSYVQSSQGENDPATQNYIKTVTDQHNSQTSISFIINDSYNKAIKKLGKNASKSDIREFIDKEVGGAMHQIDGWRRPVKQDKDFIEGMSQQLGLADLKGSDGKAIKTKINVSQFNPITGDIVITIPGLGANDESVAAINKLGIAKTAKSLGGNAFLLTGAKTPYSNPTELKDMTEDQRRLASVLDMKYDLQNPISSSEYSKAQYGQSVINLPQTFSKAHKMVEYRLILYKTLNGPVFKIMDDKGTMVSEQPTAAKALKFLNIISKQRTSNERV